MANLKINRGTTYSINYIYKKNGVAATLEGATIRFTIKSSEYDSDSTDAAALVTKNITDGTAEGTAAIIINPADTATIEPGKYFYDIKVSEPGGAIYKTDEGTVTLDASPTNRMA